MCAEIDKINIKVVCHGQYKNLPQKIMIDNTKYEDICQKPWQNASVAYYTVWGKFAMWRGTRIMIPFNEYYNTKLSGEVEHLSSHFEILYSFFINYHVDPVWNDCDDYFGCRCWPL